MAVRSAGHPDRFSERHFALAMEDQLSVLCEPQHLIDCDTPPRTFPAKFSSTRWVIARHSTHGHFYWKASAVQLVLVSCRRKNDETIGAEIPAELEGKRTLNANVLNYLLANPELIPKDWRSKEVCFWGTIYRVSNMDNSYHVHCPCHGHDSLCDWYGGWCEINNYLERTRLAAVAV
jgi:hypothetical protein